jgi:phosphoglycerol transferase
MDPPEAPDDDVVVLQQGLNTSSRRRWLMNALPPVVAVAVSSVITMLALRLWRMHMGVPFEYGDDSLPHGMHLQQIIQHGWYWSDARLGAPFSQHFQDWPLPDLTSLVTAWVLALFTNNWAVIANGMFLLSFPLVALSAWWAARKIGVSPWTSVVVGVLYSLLPYHHVRGEQHLFLSHYYVVPLAIVLAVRAISGEALFRSNCRYRSNVFRYLSWRTVQTVVICAVVGFGGVYYAAFALLFVGTAVVARLLQTRQWRVLVPGAVVAGLIVVSALMAASPTILYHQGHGANVASVDRDAADSDRYGLKLAQMLAPSPGHRIDALNDFQNRYLNTFPLPSERGSSSLGTISSIGLLYLLVIAALTLVRPATLTGSRERRGQLALFTLVGLLVAIVGGISTLISLLLSSDIRSWNRMSIYIGFFALASVALLVDAGLKRLSRRHFSIALPIVVVALIGFGSLDQTNNEWIPAYKDVDAAYLSDQTYFRGIEASLPAHAEVFELPQMSFPEAPTLNQLEAYDLLKPYLHTSTIKWSFAGVKGRVESQWQNRLADVPAQKLPENLYAAGFSGLYIDRSGYADNGKVLEAALQAELGEQPVVDSTGKKAFYDLRAYGAKQPAAELSALHDDLLFPVAFVGQKHLFGTETDGAASWQWADGNSADLMVENSTSSSRVSRVTFGLKATTETPSDVTVSWPDGTTSHVSATSAGALVQRDVTFKPGDAKIGIKTEAPRVPAAADPRNLHFRVSDLDISPIG